MPIEVGFFFEPPKDTAMRSDLNDNGFTVPELLAVVALISILIAMLLPSMVRSKEIARRAVCASNLHQLGTGMLGYAAEASGRIPIGYIDGAQGSNYHMIWSHAATKQYMMLGRLVGRREVGVQRVDRQTGS